MINTMVVYPLSDALQMTMSLTGKTLAGEVVTQVGETPMKLHTKIMDSAWGINEVAVLLHFKGKLYGIALSAINSKNAKVVRLKLISAEALGVIPTIKLIATGKSLSLSAEFDNLTSGVLGSYTYKSPERIWQEDNQQ